MQWRGEKRTSPNSLGDLDKTPNLLSLCLTMQKIQLMVQVGKEEGGEGEREGRAAQDGDADIESWWLTVPPESEDMWR